MNRTLYICDWLPPDFGAVGQYSLLFARELAKTGEQVVLVGLSSSSNSTAHEKYSQGSLDIIRVVASKYDKTDFKKRLLWTLKTNLSLIKYLFPFMRKCDRIIFTGSPPFMLHIIVPLNIFLRKELVYRITDFHPECLMASMDKIPNWLQLFYKITIYLRRRVHQFQALGEDQRERLLDIGIPADRIVIKRDPSPVHISTNTKPLPIPDSIKDHVVLLYSGNWGVAHDYKTFIDGYRIHHEQGDGRVALWLNAVGARADYVENALKKLNLPFIRSFTVPLKQLPELLLTPGAHLITLSDAFVGYVLPSKVYGCLESKKHVLYIGSKRSDIHLLCENKLAAEKYHHVNVGEAYNVAKALDKIADHTQSG